MPSVLHQPLNNRHDNNKRKKKKALLRNKHRPIKKGKKKISKPKPSAHQKAVIAAPPPTINPPPPTEVSPSEPVIEEDPIIEEDPVTEEEDPAILDDIDDEDDPLSTMVSAESFASSAEFSSLQDGIQTISSSHTNPSRAAQIVAPIISVFGGIALVAAAMFFVARKKKRNSVHMSDSPKETPPDDENKLHDVPLYDDEAVVFQAKETSLLSSGFPSIPYQQDVSYHSRFEASSFIHERASVYYNSLDYQSSMSDTLVDSTRSNSVSTKKMPNISCRTSCSSVYTDALVSPTSTVIGPHMSTFLMIAERQQLQHEKPSILDHYNDPLRSSRSTPIETYKAQLAHIVSEEEGDYVEEKGDIPIKPSSLPYYPIIDLTVEHQFY